MILYFITGTSRGIGYALARILLKDERNRVVGISRSNSLHHERFRHVPLDLGHIDHVSEVADDLFEDVGNAESIVLINNAGYLGNIRYLGDIHHSEIINVIKTNVIAPAILMNAFIRSLKDKNGRKIIINTGSGAGRNPYDGWGAYCASKAAIDMFSSVADMENGIRKGGFRIVSLTPGPVDTVMQDSVRSVDISDFSQKEKFIQLKESGNLLTAHEAAEKILTFISKIDHYREPVLDIRKLEPK